jgi:hypothetical protein
MLVCLAFRADQTPQEPRGEVWLREAGTREAELVFAFPIDDALNDAVKQIPGRWFDWHRKHWRVPADPRNGPAVTSILARFPQLRPREDVLAWLSDSGKWRGLVSLTARDGRGFFVIRTMSGDRPGELDGARRTDTGLDLLPLDAAGVEVLRDLSGTQLDDLAREAVDEIRAGRVPGPATIDFELDEQNEPQLTLIPGWDLSPVEAFRKLPESRPFERAGRFFDRGRSWKFGVPADPALAEGLQAFVDAHPAVVLEPSAREQLDEMLAEHARAQATVALSYAEDAELELELGGELHPFQRAGVRYALERRRTFIADEQGLGKTVQALATLEADDAFPAVVVCPASMKLTWEREAHIWLPGRSVALLEGRGEGEWPKEALEAEILVLNYDILDAHFERLAQRVPRALILDESHYVKNARAQRTKAALALAGMLPEGALRLNLTGTPVLNRPEELVSQLRVLGRLKEFGSGARLARRFRNAGSDDRLHWNLRAHCYVRRTKKQVLPQLPAKRHDTVPVLLSNEAEYRLAEKDVVAWLQTLPLDLRTIDAKVAAALRAEQLVRLNQLRQLAAAGKMPTALAWIGDFLESGEPLVVFAEHIAIQKELVAHFPHSVHILGSDSQRRRQDAVDAFQDEDGPQLIVCSMRAASQGITLTRASNVAFLELDWTPARHDQAEDRLHRIGQDSAVTAWYLLAPETIDETMATLLERKRTVIDAVTEGDVREEGPLVDQVVRELRARPFRHLRVVA